MKDQMVNHGNSLLKVVWLTRSSPVETVPFSYKVEFLRLQNVLDLVAALGISINSEMCTLAEITWNPDKPTFQVTMRDSFHQPILNCSSLLDVKIFPNKVFYDKQESCKKQYSKEVEVPKITNEGNGL